MSTFTHPEAAYLPLRVYLCLRTLVVVVVTLGVAGSLNGQLVAQAGSAGYTVLLAQSVFALIGLLDVGINDTLPARWRIDWMRSHRHIGYIGLAVCNCAFLLVMAKAQTLSLLGLSYAVDAAFATFIAVGTVMRNQKSRKYPYVERRAAGRQA